MSVDCPCGETYPPDLDEYRRLPLDQVVRLDDENKLELRTCTCGTLLGVNIDRDGNSLDN